jgi:ABC-2 type transport system ATP-binding protein
VTAEATAPAVAVAGLSKRYGERLALDDVSLRVAPGQLRGLLGPNGAGKTTLLRILMRLIRPDAGTVTILGRALGGAEAVPDRDVAGFVEEPAFYPYLSGAANLELLAELDDGEGPGVSEVLERVGLGARGRDRVSGYSTGMRQRLGIAAALLRSPRVLLLDEPTSGLDPGGAEAVSTLLRELCDDGVAVLLSSHLIGDLEALCDAYTVIRAGRVVWDGDAAELERAAPAAVYALATSDDARAISVAGAFAGVSLSAREGAPVASGAGALRLTVEPGVLASFVLALGREEVAVLRLELEESPLRTLFFSLTAESAA